MGTYLKQLSTKANVASQFVSKHGSAYYKQLLENNKQYIDKEPTVQKCQDLSRRLWFTRLASLPGRYESFWKEVELVKNKIRTRQDLTVEEVGVATLFAAELYAWSVLGECIGRGSLFGYYP